MNKINVGDVVAITRGVRYPPKTDDSIGIVVDELPTTGDWPVFVVMWNGQTVSLPARRLEKIEKNKPSKIQTGPAKRKDMNTIKKHLNFIKSKNSKKIYSILTNGIIEKNGK